MVVQVGKLKGPFRGFNNRQTRFTFSNGTTWRQDQPKYFYFYAANPRARVIYQENGTYSLEIDGTDETVQVIPEV
ncbi:hypothetical protein GO755_20790 [Spirosoma sp. HMF4905]|uniref:Uncharacterized protein n=1 Tax=Spirosoma arboris TaxID=2682092 RepID=A0A7K1SFD0_9BACT|nr:hypothetical protein [Spirosoma arboris]MVM32491.1 hypothetical protein [Spirosoma arboris]